MTAEAVRVLRADEWIRSITDISATVHEVAKLVRARRITGAAPGLPAEREYPILPALARRVGAVSGNQAPTAEAGGER